MKWIKCFIDYYNDRRRFGEKLKTESEDIVVKLKRKYNIEVRHRDNEVPEVGAPN